MNAYMIQNGSKRLTFNEKNRMLSAYLGEELLWQQDAETLITLSAVRPWKLAYPLQLKQIHAGETALNLTFANPEILAVLHLTLLPEGPVSLQLKLENCSEKAFERFTCGLTLCAAAPSAQKVTIPHVIYNDNPSADPDRVVPHIGKQPGKGLIVEEHRLPIPGVNLEWKDDSGSQFLTLLSIPSIVTGEDKDYWSLGALYGENGHTIAALSGPLMFNGQKDLVYGGQCTPLPYERGYRTFLSGETIHKQFLLDFGPTNEGRGFRNLVELGFLALKPENHPAHTFQEMTEYKKRVLDSRFTREAGSCGYLCFGAANGFGNLSRRPEYYLYAWTGQALKLAWGECALGLLQGDTPRLERALETVDFFVNGSEGDTPGLLRCYYMIEAGSWRGSWDHPEADLSSRMEGEALIDLIDILALLRTHQQPVPAAWEALVERCCAFLADPSHWTAEGVYPAAWTLSGAPASQMINTAGVPCIDALVKAANYFGRKEYLDTAKNLFAHYYDYHMKTFDLPFARSTLDAKCEDKEAGIYMFCSAAELYKATGDSFYKEAADVAADWLLTFVYFWETGFQPGSPCAENHFTTTGWPGVSVQNHHLDVFFPSWEMYDYGKRTNNHRLMHMGRTVAQALTHGVCTVPGEWGYTVVGEQGEQYYQTNYFQIRYPVILQYMDRWRGGMQCWNPSWITAQVLQASLRFMEE